MRRIKLNIARKLIVLLAVFSLGFCIGIPIADAQQAKEQSPGLKFDFRNAPWQGVIEWFAEEAGYNLDPVDQWPEGGFTLQSDEPLSPIAAIDEINHKLRLSDPPKTLLRNRSKLYLVDATRSLPAELVETIPVSDLDNRGKYEPLQVIFNVADLDIDEIEKSIRQRVSDYNQKSFQVYRSSKQIFVRETGENLRFIRDSLDAARQNTMLPLAYSLKHYSAELLLKNIQPLLGLDDENKSKDGTLRISVDQVPGSQRLILFGTPAAIRSFERIAKVMDVPVEEQESVEIDAPYPVAYPVSKEPEMTFNVLDRLLLDYEGTRITLGKETGRIIVYGRKDAHQTVIDTLSELEGKSGETLAVVKLKNGNAVEVLAAVQSLLGQSADDKASGPTMIANSARDFIMVRGKPLEVLDTRRIIEDIDSNLIPLSDGLRTERRVIPMSAGERDRIMGSLEEYWPTMGRKNTLRIERSLPMEQRGKNSNGALKIRSNTVEEPANRGSDSKSTAPQAQSSNPQGSHSTDTTPATTPAPSSGSSTRGSGSHNVPDLKKAIGHVAFFLSPCRGLSASGLLQVAQGSSSARSNQICAGKSGSCAGHGFRNRHRIFRFGRWR